MKNLKAIKWHQPVTFINYWWGDSPLGRYFVLGKHGWYSCESKDQTKLKSFRSLDAAKAYCSAHYAALVASLFDDADTTLKGTQ